MLFALSLRQIKLLGIAIAALLLGISLALLFRPVETHKNSITIYTILYHDRLA